MYPDHETSCAPVMVVAHGMLGLCIHIAERYPVRPLVCSLQQQLTAETIGAIAKLRVGHRV